MRKVLEVRNLKALSREGSSLSPSVDFDLQEGDVLFLRGDNGSGKSSVLKTLLGLHKHYEGRFQFSISEQEIQYLPQLGSLNFHLPLTLQDMLPEPARDLSVLKGLDLSKKWNTASGGERQKVLLAAVIAKNPKILVLDEPFNHVDKDSIQTLEEALAQFLTKNPQSSLIIVSHRAFVQSWPTVKFVEIR
ncbi:MAG: magnesium ABC transporter ATPase [Bdellovibrio sp. ArHS]|uniref:ATP-binding cassette domain-containing protein n=1 Tax=Bdellovibrio sp. ArHS TaxID=1569284 RepID=UPI0005823EBF|nr:ATP-binding cassette domain-containing protein [Bdellovibrio sp. ArHS]KHD89094.1 MAG: magnesium ABC transporter ATPase [Bdellovibrio sp. ArHS]